MYNSDITLLEHVQRRNYMVRSKYARFSNCMRVENHKLPTLAYHCVSGDMTTTFKILQFLATAETSTKILWHEGTRFRSKLSFQKVQLANVWNSLLHDFAEAVTVDHFKNNLDRQAHTQKFIYDPDFDFWKLLPSLRLLKSPVTKFLYLQTSGVELQF